MTEKRSLFAALCNQCCHSWSHSLLGGKSWSHRFVALGWGCEVPGEVQRGCSMEIQGRSGPSPPTECGYVCSRWILLRSATGEAPCSQSSFVWSLLIRRSLTREGQVEVKWWRPWILIASPELEWSSGTRPVPLLLSAAPPPPALLPHFSVAVHHSYEHMLLERNAYFWRLRLL